MADTSDPTLPERNARPLLRRGLLLLLLLVAEYVAIALSFDGLMHRYPGPWEHLTDLVTFSALGVAAVFVMFGRRVTHVLRVVLEQHPPRADVAGPLAAHLLGYGAMLGMIALLATREWTPTGFGVGVVGLTLCGSVSLVFLLLALLPGAAYRTLLSQLRTQLLLGLLAGACAFGAGFAASFAWHSTAGLTLLLAAGLLRGAGMTVEVIPEELVLVADGFAVRVAKECSGLEGIGLLVVFLALYLYASRDRFLFPRALVVFPVGIVAMYLANLLRIVLLIAMGARISPAIALGGFHSKAGWVFFSAVSLSLVALTSRTGLLLRPEERTESEPEERVDNDAAVYLMPLLAMIASYLLTSLLLAASFDPLYGLRVFAVAGVLWLYREPLRRIPRSVSWLGPVAGAVGFALWMLLMPAPEAESHAELAEGLSNLPAGASLLWVGLRLVGSVVTVPIAEELAFRGFLLRRVASADFTAVPFNRMTWAGLVLSSLAFGALHSAYVAGTVVGLLYGVTMWRRSSLGDAVAAHATTNALLSGYVLLTGEYGYW